MPSKIITGGKPVRTAQARAFNPEGSGFDMERALASGMTQAGPEAGENEGHWGSVVPTTAQERSRFGLPENSFLVLKGKRHPSFDKAVEAEERRGFVVKKFGNRYYSVPQ